VHTALRALGYPSAEAVFLGDSPHDMLAANAAGVISVAAEWGPFSAADLDAARPTHRVKRMADFPALVARLGAP
jgi:phosphoglycolate phosphatase-like HAD superfamily hydrolase